jgi:predicted enzyme related to lactoylglutathione lyase
MSFHGLPCWYELASPDPDGSQTFYAGLLGWTWAESGMPGMDYRLAALDDSMIAGLMKPEPGQPPGWTIYYAVDDCDASAALAASLGAQVVMPPADIPGTGRVAMLTDPHGAGFGLLQPLPMADGSIGGAFARNRPGHGDWAEMVCPDPQAAMAFYGKLLGWTPGREVPMGPDMVYHLFQCGGQDIGGMFADGATLMWKPYFGTGSTKAAAARIPQIGGTVLRGPDAVPDGGFTVQLKDPQGIVLALSGTA